MSFKAYLFAPHWMHSVCPCMVFLIRDLYGELGLAWGTAGRSLSSTLTGASQSFPLY